MICPNRRSSRSNANRSSANHTVVPPDSPSTTKLKRLFHQKMQKKAFNKLLTLIAANSGSSSEYGLIKNVLTKYEKLGCSFVMRRNLNYHMSLHLSVNKLVDEKAIPRKKFTCDTDVSSFTSKSKSNSNTTASSIRIDDACKTNFLTKKDKGKNTYLAKFAVQ